MKQAIITVGRGGCDWSDRAISDYAKRLRRYGGIEERFVKPETFRGNVDAVRQREGERILRKVDARDRLVVMDERGLALDTMAFTALIEECRNHGVPRICWAIGGPYGHDPSVRDAAWRVVRLSSLVLNHDIARVVLYEQIYRSMAIIHNVPYHH